ncbi:nuclear transport factor 2 family protein [Nocardia africana]|uniref:Uncharacterized protein n=1 Tax=Nocardia africana TaxID=134964 RepID=A0A378WX31_9NOCA|nr:nuclear transport factor 2 family protein [Nocardia africana]MCC3313744.1 nuclear transport factor 2 family protein [Nocardia africana]SUA44873.1 Uncharacterised protein [Nocardia africana]
MSTLDRRRTRLEDLAAIQELAARYARAINHGYAGKTLDTEAVREVFTPGARWHSDGFGGSPSMPRPTDPCRTRNPNMVAGLIGHLLQRQ